jgi:hypothetical protein
MAELPVGAGAAGGCGSVGDRRREVMDVIVVQVEVRPRRRRQLAAGEDVRLQRRDAAHEWIVEQPVVHATCCQLPAVSICGWRWIGINQDRRRWKRKAYEIIL